MPKPTTAADTTPVRVVIVTLDSHLGGAFGRAYAMLKRDYPGIVLTMHAASEWAEDPDALARCNADIAKGDIIIATMLFMEEHIKAVFPALKARRDSCDVMVGCMSASEVVRLTKVGRFRMGDASSSSLSFLKRLRGKSGGESSGADQLKMLKRIPKILRFIPGTAQDVRAYFLTLQYWLAGSEHNVANMIRLLIDRFADGPRKGLRGKVKVELPAEYPDTGLYHPAIPGRVTDRIEKLPRPKNTRATVGLLVMRSYILAGNTAHYDGVIAALEARGLAVVTAFASGLDARPAATKYFFNGGRPAIDALVSLTGFSLVGGPAYNDARAAEEMLAALDVPCISATPLEFQTIEQWQDSDRGLSPVEATMMVAIPELDGSVGSMVFGGRSDEEQSADGSSDMRSEGERAQRLADRVVRQIALGRTPASERRVAIVLFNFPPNAGAIGTAAYLSVFESLHNTLTAMRASGYAVDMPETVDELREAIIEGNGGRYGQDANVHFHIPASDHVKRERHLAEIEAQWGPAPGKQLSDGRGIYVLGRQFGNVLVGIQPSFGYEGDPMRLLFEKGFSPTHAFSAFYRYIDQDFGAHAVVHFGTHGALEFMPGKQVGMSAACWPDRLIGSLPNIYLYAANNPSEGTIAKRRSAATIVSYLTPPVSHAGLYRGLIELKATIERWRAVAPDAEAERMKLAEAIQAQAAVLDMVPAEPAWSGDGSAEILKLAHQVLELEYTLIPHGLHVVGGAMNEEERADLLVAIADSSHGVTLDRKVAEAIAAGASPERLRTAQGKTNALDLQLLEDLAKTDRLLSEDHEVLGLLRALDGRYIRPAPGGDVLRTPAVLPTGRNLHGFDPFRIPSSFAAADGARQTERLLARHQADGHGLPRTVAVVLWGTDNLKTEGGPIAQVLALIGARARFDGYGRLAGADLIPLAELGRPRIDVVVTVSGIFRDLLPLQMKLLAEACYLAAAADEPLEQNFVRAHALEHQKKHGCDLETASLRVFSNADGAYGSNVSHLIDSGRWDDEDELAETYTRRKSFAYGRTGKPAKQADLLKSMLAGVELTYQNLDSVELGVTSIDHYFDTLGGITRSVMRASGQEQVPVYIGDQTRGQGQVRTLGEQVALETRTRMLNPKWYEGMLKHGYEGVRQIEAHVTNTMGWSATTGEVAQWVYQQLSQTYVLDPEMRRRLAELNPQASARVANRLIEAHERNYWNPDESVLAALREAGEELEDRLEGIGVGAAA
ncbi:MAG: magnesium chelatase subunit H [Hyphomicrobiales bacterium]